MKIKNLKRKKLFKCLFLLLLIFLLSINLGFFLNEKNLVFSKNKNKDNKRLTISSKKARYISDELIIKLKDDQPLFSTQSLKKPSKTNITALNSLNQKFKVTKIEKVIKKDEKDNPLNKLYVLKLPKNTNLEKALFEYKKNPAIETVTFNYYFYLTDTPDDPYFVNQWGLNNTGQEIIIGEQSYRGTPYIDIDALKAWDIEKGLTSDVVVAVIDTGVNYNHEDLQENMWTNAQGYHGYNFVNNSNDPMDTHGHGTHCAGIIAARTNNEIGVAGVAGGWDNPSKVKIMALKVTDTDEVTLEKIIAAIDWAKDPSHKADIINLSLGIQESKINQEAIGILQSTVNTAYNAGCILVAAAGNEGTEEKFYPAACENVISVAATGHCQSIDQGYYFDDRKACYSNYGTWVDISAPGTGICSTYKDNSSYGYMSGTSMASPMVCGTLSLLKSHFSSFSKEELIQRLINTADNIDYINTNYQGKLGSGRVNAYKALVGVSVNSINPNYGVNNTSVNVVITGMGFKENATVKLTKEGEEDINGTSVTVSSATQITCTFNLTGAKAGKWNVVVTNPSEEPVVLTNGFTIYNPPPIVRSIYPNQHENKGSVNVTISGSGFLKGAFTKLTKEGQNDISGTNVNVESFNKITCTFNLNNAMPGTWNVEVINYESLPGILRNGFTITGITPTPTPTPSPSPSSSHTQPHLTSTISSGPSLIIILLYSLFFFSIYQILKFIKS